ncbi:MAG: hypothetical protein ABW202_05155 [Duganella sp.]
MKRLQQQWLVLSARIDALSLRERVLVFAAVTAAILFVLFTVAIEPLLARQAALLAQIQQQNTQIGTLDNEAVSRAQSFVADPDAGTRTELSQAQVELTRLGAQLMNVQKGLVAPQKIAPLLEQLLRGNGKLKLLSMKSLPVTGMNEASAAAGPAEAAVAPAGGASGAALLSHVPPPAGATLDSVTTAAAATAMVAAAASAPAPVNAGQPATPAPVSKPRELLYRHGVEIVLQGSYLDMIQYMQGLEALPVQLFWGGARLDAEQWPQARLTLTLYTLSMDEKWMKL